MNDRSLDAWFAKAREAKAMESLAAPPGFAAVVWQKYQRRRAEERMLVQASTVSLTAALLILAAVVGLNFDSLTAPSDDPGYSGDLASSVWDFTGD